MSSISFSELKPKSAEEANVLSNIKRAGTNSSSGAYNPALFYKIDPSSWYETYPFSFDLRESVSETLKDSSFEITDIPKSYIKCRFFLPIPPQNYTIQDMSTSEAHATIGGVVEEVNAPVFSMITLVGTTGLSLKSPNLGDGVDKDLLTKGRKYIDEVDTSKLGKLVKDIGFSVLNNVLLEQEDSLQYQDGPSAVNTPGMDKKIDALFKNADIDSGNFFEKWSKSVQESIEGQKLPQNEFTNGWAWSKALRQFFLIFQRERASNTNLELYFVDHKSRAHYRCVPRSVQFQQNANSPYLINYTIILKCWQIQDVDDIAVQAKSVDRFKGDLKEVATASITGIVSKVGKVCNNLNRFPSVAGSFVRNSTGSFL